MKSCVKRNRGPILPTFEHSQSSYGDKYETYNRGPDTSRCADDRKNFPQVSLNSVGRKPIRIKMGGDERYKQFLFYFSESFLQKNKTSFFLLLLLSKSFNNPKLNLD